MYKLRYDSFLLINGAEVFHESLTDIVFRNKVPLVRLFPKQFERITEDEYNKQIKKNQVIIGNRKPNKQRDEK